MSQCHTPHPADGLCLTPPFGQLPQQCPRQHLPRGLGRTFPPSRASLPLTILRDREVWTFQSLQTSRSRWPGDQVCYGEAGSHFSTLNTLVCALSTLLPLPLSQPSWQETPRGFLPPSSRCFICFCWYRCRPGPGKAHKSRAEQLTMSICSQD